MAASKRGGEGIKNNRCKYRESGIAVTGMPGVVVRSHSASGGQLVNEDIRFAPIFNKISESNVVRNLSNAHKLHHTGGE